MSSMNIRGIAILAVAAVILGSIVGVLMYGEKADQQQEEAPPQESGQAEARQVAERIASYLQAFARLPPSPNYSPELMRLYMLLNSDEPVVILFWPSNCGSCIQYKEQVWDQVKTLFNNVSFVDYRLDTPEGATIASVFEISGITIVLSYNGTVLGAVYGEHLPPQQLAEAVRLLAIHASRGVGT